MCKYLLVHFHIVNFTSIFTHNQSHIHLYIYVCVCLCVCVSVCVCVWVCVVYPHTNISGNIIQHNLRTSMNELTHFFVKICISHTLFSKGLVFLWCLRDEWRQGQTAILTQQLLLTIARCVIFKNPLSTSSASWLGFLNRDSLRATTLRGRSQSASWFSLWPSCHQLTQLPPVPDDILS